MAAAGIRAVRSAPGGAGLALAVLSAATFATSGPFGSALIGAGWSPAAAVFARIAGGALILTIPALMQLRGRWALLRHNAKRVAAYGVVAVAGTQLVYFNAIARIPVGIAILIEYLGVVLVVGWLWLRQGQRPRRLTVTGGVAALAGLGMVLDLSGSARLDPLGVMWALFGAVGLATFFVLSAADTGGEQVPPIIMTWAGMCTATLVLALLGVAGLLPMNATAGDVHVMGHQVGWFVPVIGLALFAAVISYVTGIGAARRLGAKLASFVGLAEALFAIVFAWLLLGQLPTGLQFLGGAFILAGVALVRVDELRGPPAARSAEARAARTAGRGQRPGVTVRYAYREGE